MSLNLTPEESNKIDENKKPYADLPQFYSAALNREVPISRDFESFLILSTDEVKQDANKWIRIVSNGYKKNKDRDTLLEKAINNDAADAAAKVDELNSTLTEFNAFRENFITSSKFNSITEVGMIISDFQRSFAEITLSQDRYNHLVVFSNILKARLDKENSGDQNTKQLESWSDSLNSY